MIDERGDNLSHNPLPPEFLGRPITHLGGKPVNIFADGDSDAADGRSVDLDTMRFLLPLAYCSLDEIPRVFDSIRIWKAIAQVDRDAAIVSMLGQRFGVFHAPVPDRAALEFKLHVYFNSSFVSANALTANSK